MTSTFADLGPRYHAHGFNVLPIMPGSKAPPQGALWKPWQARRQREDEVSHLVTAYPQADVAILTGRFGRLVDIETDGRKGEESLRELRLPLPPTASWESPRGVHRLYRASRPLPSRAGRGALGAQLEVHSEGRYVIAPTSTGRNWTVPGGFDAVVALPEQWEEQIFRINRKPRAISQEAREQGWAAEALKGVPEGMRTDTCKALAGYFFGKGVARDVVEATMLAWNSFNRPPLPCEKVTSIVCNMSGFVGRLREERSPAVIRTLLDLRTSPWMEVLTPGEILQYEAIVTVEAVRGLAPGAELFVSYSELARYGGVSVRRAHEVLCRLRAHALIHFEPAGQRRGLAGQAAILARRNHFLTCPDSPGPHSFELRDQFKNLN